MISQTRKLNVLKASMVKHVSSHRGFKILGLVLSLYICFISLSVITQVDCVD